MTRTLHIPLLALALTLLPQGAHAAFITYTTNLSGPAESPPNASPGSGFAQVDVDTVARTLRARATFTGLTGLTTAAHIHATTATPGAGLAGVATQTPSFVGFPLGVTAGAFDLTLDMALASSYNPAFVTANGGTIAGAEAALLAALNTGRAYFNIHTTTFSGGEIRGFLTPVPEPASVASLGLGAVVASAVALGRRRRRGTIDVA